MSVIDGVHRLLAAKLRGREEIDTRLVDGDRASCFVVAVRANITHGLPLSLDDRKAAAVSIINFYPHWSDRMIASVSGLAARTVAGLRHRPTAANHQLDSRVGRDGRIRPLNPAERRRTAAALLEENPAASLRDIARQAGVSPETVRGVRRQLRDGRTESVRAHPVPSPETEPSSGVHPARYPDPDPAEALALEALRRDPALRSTERGRLLLKMLGALEVLKDHGDQIIGTVPEHNMRRIAEASRACSRAWERFAESAERHTGTVTGQ